MANRRDIQFFLTPHNKPKLVDCSFQVASTDAGGLGIINLDQGGRIASVFMHTTQTPGVVNGVTNPNPAAGYIVVNFEDNYYKYLGHFGDFLPPVTGAAISSGLTVGVVYEIAALGASTLAQWQAAGLYKEIVPAVGATFVAKATSVAGGGTVKALTTSGIDHTEILGNPAVMNAGGAGGAQLILGCYKDGVLTAPVDGTILHLEFYFNDTAFGV